jgi:hypothetical protein
VFTHLGFAFVNRYAFGSLYLHCVESTSRRQVGRVGSFTRFVPIPRSAFGLLASVAKAGATWTFDKHP